MAFEVPQSKRDLPENRFEFTIDGETYDVPMMGFLPGSVVEELAEKLNKGGIHAEASNYAAFGPADSSAGKAVRALDRDQFQALLAAYVEASKITPGESSASTDS